MGQRIDFDLVFALPDGAAHDPYALSDAVIGAGFADAVIGTGDTGMLAVSLDAEEDSVTQVKQQSARRLLDVLPEGTRLLA
ncbi:MAG: hypothetical protein ACQETX_06495 [Pseudomonadota bacterium]|uniref:hypothetical protein n=1 Tax=Fodinicurvata fenggangensis TaxID=1121830 RepID=UPI00068C7C26|nr:hypothetical protein [Fodinicurvata fenggangensis]